MAFKNKKQKKSVIGKFPLGGQIGGITPDLLALIQKYAEEQKKGVTDLNNGITPDSLAQVPTDLSSPTDLGKALTPDLGIDIGSTAPPIPGSEKPVPPSFMGALGKELTKQAPAFSLLGGLSTSLANKPGYAPDVAQGVTGGALSGLGAGLSMGGPMGGLIGLIGGGAMGFMQSGQKRDDYETALERAKKQRVKDRTVDPFMGVLYAEEGGITPGEIPAEELSPVQTEMGEMLLMPSGILTETKAKEKHEDMDADDVTDVLPAGTIIFSNSMDKMLPINEEIEDIILGYGTAFYSEDGEASEVEAVEFEDVLDEGKKKMTFADIARNIKNKFATVPDHKDVFNNITNVENMQARIPFLMKLNELQDKVMGNSSIPTTATAQSFSKGGVVKKYPLGGQIGGLTPELLDMIKGYFSPYVVPSGENNPPPPPPPGGDPMPPGGGTMTPPNGGGYTPTITIDDLLKKHREFLDNTKTNLEKENTDRTNADLALEKDLRRNNVLANAVIGPMGYLMQNPQVKPAYVDTNLSGAMFRPGSTQAAQGIANTGLGQTNSLAQELLRQGVNPVDAISMTASARNAATVSANDINYKTLQKNEELDRAKYKFLSEARTSNEAADVKAYNDTTDNQNKIIAGLAGEGKTFLKDDSSIDVGANQWRTQRAKDYYESITNLDKSGLNLNTKLYEIDAAKKQAFDQEEMLKKFLDQMKGNTSGNNGGTDTGTDTGKDVVGGNTGGNEGNKDGTGELIQVPPVSGTPAPMNIPEYKPVVPNADEVSLPSPEEASKMTPEQIGNLQQIINADRAKKGLAPIAEDKKYGPETRKALEQTQSPMPIQYPTVSDTPTSMAPVTNPSPTPNVDEVSLPSPDEAKDMNPEQIGNLQKIINKDRVAKGLKPIAEDKKWGPETKKALEDVQAAKTTQTGEGTRRIKGEPTILGTRSDVEETTDKDGNVLERNRITVKDGQDQLVGKEIYDKSGLLQKSYEKDEFGWDINTDYKYTDGKLSSKVELGTYTNKELSKNIETKTVITYDPATSDMKELSYMEKDDKGNYVEKGKKFNTKNGNEVVYDTLPSGQISVRVSGVKSNGKNWVFDSIQEADKNRNLYEEVK